MKRPWTERLGDLVLGRGFYIVLVLCVAAMGVSGYYLMRSASGMAGEDPAKSVTGTASVPAPDGGTAQTKPDPKPAIPTPPVTTKPAPQPAKTEPEPTEPAKTDPAPAQTKPETPSPKPAPAVYTWPVKGEVLRTFSVETLSYDTTMRDWRAHAGLDISAVEGTLVSAMRGGTIHDVYDDDMMGTTVVIDHGDGMVSAYSGLAAKPPVSTGDQVDAGSTIGSVGKPPLGESALTPHLHLSLTVDGVDTDPLEYLPQN